MVQGESSFMSDQCDTLTGIVAYAIRERARHRTFLHKIPRINSVMLLIYAASDIVVAEHNVSTSIVIRNQIPMMMYIFDPEQNVAIDYYLTVFFRVSASENKPKMEA